VFFRVVRVVKNKTHNNISIFAEEFPIRQLFEIEFYDKKEISINTQL